MKSKILSLALGAVLGAASSLASAYDINKMSWDDIEAQAKEEGQVTFSVWYLQDRWRIFVKDFENEYGIKVRIPEGSLDGNIKKLMAEKKREQGRMDIIAISLDRSDMLRKLDVLEPMDVIQDGFRKTSFSNEKKDNRAFVFWGNQTGLAYDPSRVDESRLPQTFADLESWIEKNPEQFGFNDPNGGGSGQAFIQASIRNLAPTGDYTQAEADKTQLEKWAPVWNWFEKEEDKFILTASNADSLSRINDGEISMAPAWEDHLDTLQQKGAVAKRIKIYIPEFGMGGSGNLAAIAKNAPHQAASALFVKWLTSKETQGKMNKMFGSAPQHPEADDSNSLIPGDQRENSTVFFSNAYKNAANRAFIEKIVM